MILAIAIGLGMMGQAKTFDLVKNGKSDWKIVIPSDSALAVRHGASEIQHAIKEMSGATLPIEERVKIDKNALNHTLLIEGSMKVHDRFPPSPEEFSYAMAPSSISIGGGGPRGALYGCYGFLEDVLGCRWYTSKITKIPKRKTITLKRLFNSERPAFEYREPFWYEAFDKDWAAHNRCNGNSMRLDDSVGGKVSYGKFVHTFSELVPPEKYFATHPEYFSLVNGQRQGGYAQLCLTNPDVLKICIDKVREWIKENPKATIFSVSQNDTYLNCQCANCVAVENEEGAPSGPLLRFVNKVAEAIEKDHPNVLIDTLAYQWSEKPPSKVKPRPNVRIRLAPIGACFSHPLDGCEKNKAPYANLQAWAKITNQLYIWHYCTDFANYLQPLPGLDEIAGDIKIFKNSGVVGLFYEGAYAEGGGGEMAELKAYLQAKLMWNPNRDAKAIIADFLQGVYGNAAPYIQQWLDIEHGPARKDKVDATIYDPPNAAYLTPEIISQGQLLFDQAEKTVATDPVALEQVQKARMALDYVQLMNGSVIDPAQHAALAKKVLDELARFGVTQVREGEPVEQFKKRIGQ